MNHSHYWFKESIVYQILVDRFAGYDPKKDWQKPLFMGGCFNGITERLSYLKDLGINTIWLSPIYSTTVYHGYHVTDYYATESSFGSEKEFIRLIESAHRKHIRVILDFVPNHCSVQHPFFQEALTNHNSRYRKWFYFKSHSNNYVSFLDFKEIPKIRLENKGARDHIIGAAKYWLEKGVDGFRLDHVVGPGHRFWKEFSREVWLQNPEAVLIGEAWMEGIKFSHLKTIRIRNKYIRWLFHLTPRQIQREYSGELDGVLDFFFRYLITRYIAWKENPDDFHEKLLSGIKKHYRHFPEDYFLPSFVDNHDMSRFIFETGQNQEKLKKALKLQFSLPQPPILYYGTETALTHEVPVDLSVPYSDLQARKPMPWESLDMDMVNYCRELIKERKTRNL